jgi:RecA-family ATPase
MIPESTDFVRGNEYLLLPRDPQPWIVQDLIPIGGLVNIYAKPKIGKSFVALGMANAIADEKVDSYLGFPVKRHGRVAYLQLDTPRSFWGERIEKIVNIHNWNLHDVFIADRLMAPRGFDIVKDEPHKWLVAQMKRIKPICVIIDTLREAHCQDEDNATQMKAVVTSILDAIPDSAIVFVSHSRKSFQNIADDIMDDMRGSGYIAGRMDCIIKMSEKTLRCRSRAGDTQITIQQHPNISRLHPRRAC